MFKYYFNIAVFKYYEINVKIKLRKYLKRNCTILTPVQ